MATKEGIAPKEDKEIAVKPKGGALATAEDSQKLDELLRNRNLTQQQFQVLKHAIHPNASCDASVLMAFDYCAARKIDPFKRAIHIVPVYSKKAGTMVDTVWPGIAEVRTTAHRTGVYAGCEECKFGPDVTRAVGGVSLTYHEWAQFVVYRMQGDTKIAWPGPKVRWLEEYATESNKSATPNDKWATRPYGQLEKCAEAAALRRAFPEETDYCAEEMEGKTMHDVSDAYEAAPPEPSVKEVKIEKATEKKAERKAEEKKAEPPKPESQSPTSPPPTVTTQSQVTAISQAGATESKAKPEQIVLKLPEVSQPDEVQDAELVEDDEEEEEDDDSYTKAPLAAPSKPKAGDIKWS